jgi:hypothetical protein
MGKIMSGLLRDLAGIVLSKRKQAELYNLYIGLRHRRRDDIFHRWDCEYGGRIGFRGYLFKSRSEAKAAGFRPCRVCKPDRYPYQREDVASNASSELRRTVLALEENDRR